MTAAQLHHLGKANSIATQYVAELRDTKIHGDRARFRCNLKRLGQIAAYEISKSLPYICRDVVTPLGTSPCQLLKEQPVLGTILRAGIPLYEGMLSVLDQADSAFLSAYRAHASDGSFTIKLEYVSCPELDNRVLILADPMLATGQSIEAALAELPQFGTPREVHIVSVIASQPGLDRLCAQLPTVHFWTFAVDPALDGRAYIVPGLGDAGDLAFGTKVQN